MDSGISDHFDPFFSACCGGENGPAESGIHFWPDYCFRIGVCHDRFMVDQLGEDRIDLGNDRNF